MERELSRAIKDSGVRLDTRASALLACTSRKSGRNNGLQLGRVRPEGHRGTMAVSKGDLPDERAQHLLRVLVDKYIREGQPVGSRTLSRDSGLDLSPATIRNIMADLEEMGFVSSPHTSAGRVPTIKGYRLFVDTLIKLSPPRDDELASFREKLQEVSGEDPQSLATSVST